MALYFIYANVIPFYIFATHGERKFAGDFRFSSKK
jgi:hypothetical protein